jgi:hypothetical protein
MSGTSRIDDTVAPAFGELMTTWSGTEHNRAGSGKLMVAKSSWNNTNSLL